MKYLNVIICLIFINHNTITQRYGNEWINYDIKYLKIIIDQPGIYRISQSEIQNLNFVGLNSNPKYFQLFHRGKEIAINIKGEDDNVFDSDDYIEFYAINNDGKQDTALYNLQENRPHNFISLYSDETAYFLTYGNSQGKRMGNKPTEVNTLSPEKYVWTNKINVFNSEWNFDISKSQVPNIILSKYEKFESLTGPVLNIATNPEGFSSNITLENYYKNEPLNVHIEAMIVGRNYLNRSISLFSNNSLLDVAQINQFNGAILDGNVANLPENVVPINIKITSNPSNSANNAFSLFYYKVKYPRNLVFNNEEVLAELEPNSINKSLLVFPIINTTYYGIDITDFENQRLLNFSENAGNYWVTIDNTINSRKIFLSPLIKHPKHISQISFDVINRNLYDFLIITDKRLESSSTEYKNYRESVMGGGYKVIINYTDKIYDEFSFGERNPIAIRRYIDYMTFNSNHLKNVLLIGKSYSRPNGLKANISLDFVPTFGYPGSDNQFTMGLNNNNYIVPSVPIGRISGTNNNEILNYLNKVKAHEAQNTIDKSWQKNLLSIVGPGTQDEYVSLYNTLEAARSIAVASSFGANFENYITYNKPSSSYNPTTQTYNSLQAPFDFYEKLNNGAGILIYFGHGSSVSTTYNIGFASTNPIVNNINRYPLLIGFGCSIGNSFGSATDLISDWVNTPNKGAILGLGQSYLSYEYYDNFIIDYFYRTLFGAPSNSGALASNNMTDKTIGEVIKQTYQNMYNELAILNPTIGTVPVSIGLISTLEQTILLGDPAVLLFKAQQNQPLDVNLLSFDVNPENFRVKLTWATANESEFDSFILQKSENLSTFFDIGKVNGKNKEKNNYEFYDYNLPSNGATYYRLQLVDKNGIFKYSKIKAVIISDKTKEIVLKNNPIEKNSNIEFEFNDYLVGSAYLVNAQGIVVNTKERHFEKNSYLLENSKNLPAGKYILKLSDKVNKEYSKAIIIN